MPKSKELKFEEQLAKLEALVDKMEHPETTLDASLVLFEEGVALTRACQSQLAEAKRKIEILMKASGDLHDFEESPEDKPHDA